MVVYGRNGAGKSSFVDAIEYVINKGKLAHLSHEYSGRNQEKAIPNTHIPADRSTEFWIKFQDDAELNIKIAPDGTHTKTGGKTVAIPMIATGLGNYDGNSTRGDGDLKFCCRGRAQYRESAGHIIQPLLMMHGHIWPDQIPQ